MKRYILFIIIIFILGVFIQGKRAAEPVSSVDIDVSDNNYLSWKDKLTDSLGIPAPAVNLAMNGYFALKSENLLKNDTLITIIDFSKSSTVNRFYILDIKNQDIIKSTWVAHGVNSGVDIAESFSNKKHSNKSSLGLYLTNETYSGKHGYSLRLDGLSKGLNDNARSRAIVIHGANYVGNSFIEKNGRNGRSFGCPALAYNESEEIIKLIKNGTCLFIYHPLLIPISQADLEKLP